ncbi:MAG TPA: hypothetical protein VD788_05380 [Candidatus Polarisedimenticolaceae bacterium]|nr:hypothetical protein [Candidatus Polarisedimenticolaceae bacterium]
MAKRILRTWLWIGACTVVSWRLLALARPHPAAEDPAVVRLALAGLGLLFVACGMWAWHRRPGVPTRLFALYGLASGLHWGGPLGIGTSDLQTFELVFYVVASSVLGGTLLLHLALVFPRRLPPSTLAGAMAVLYAPATIGGLSALGSLAAAGRSLVVVNRVLPLLLVVATAYGYAAAASWIGRLILSPADRRAGSLPLIVTALLGGALPHLVVSSIGPPHELGGLWNLLLAAFPIALAFALIRDRVEPASPPPARGYTTGVAQSSPGT